MQFFTVYPIYAGISWVFWTRKTILGILSGKSWKVNNLNKIDKSNEGNLLEARTAKEWYIDLDGFHNTSKIVLETWFIWIRV